MIKQAPSAGRIAVMIGFTLSCFGIVLFLWNSFGGSIPLSPKGYRYYADFGEAIQLTDNADVRISGVKVGRVVSSEPHGVKTRATIEIDSPYAPIASTSKAVLRAKTLLGETYVEVTPGDRNAPKLKEEGVLPGRQVLATTELDEILRALDPKTRRDLQKLLGGFANGLRGRGEDLNQALGNLGPFADDSTQVLRVLDSQHRAVTRLVRDTGDVLGSISARRGELTSLVRSGDRVLDTTARRDAELTRAIRILPTTLRELRPTMAAVEGLSHDAAPVFHDLRPGGRAFAPALRDTAKLAPELQGLFGDVDRVAGAAKTGLPAATRVVHAAQPVFQILDPTLREAVPVVQYLLLFKQDLVTSFANLASATQASQPAQPGGDPIHYIRVVVPFTEEGFAGHAKRLGTNRHNPYFTPGGLMKLPSGLESIDCSNTGNASGGEPAPPCKVQSPLEWQGKKLAYPHVEPESR